MSAVTKMTSNSHTPHFTNFFLIFVLIDVPSGKFVFPTIFYTDNDEASDL